MNTIESILYLSAVSICVFCLLLVLVCREHIKKLPHFLVFIIALYATGFTVQVLMHSPQSYWKHLWMFLAIAHSFILGPAVWLYGRYLIAQPANWRVLNGWKRGILLGAMVMASPLLVLVHNSAGWIDDSHPSSPTFWTLYYGLAAGYVVAYFVQALMYIYLLSALNTQIFGEKLGLRFFFKTGNHHSVHIQIFKLILLGYYASVFINLCRVIHCGLIAEVTVFSPVLSIMDISITLLVLLSILVGMVKHSASLTESRPSVIMQSDTDKYLHSALDDSARSRIKTKLESVMLKPEVFTASDLTLPKLANIVGEKHHYVSQVINQELATTFFDLVNRARVEHAKWLMQQNTSLAIIDLIELVGFNSKSTFYNAFSKYVGTTPAKFKSATSAISPTT